MPLSFRERTSNVPPSGRFTVDVGSNTRTFVLFDPLHEQLFSPAVEAVPRSVVARKIRAILGTTNPGPSTVPFGSPGGKGSLDRVLPWADPLYFSLFADSTSVNVQQMEGFELQTADGDWLAVPPELPQYAGYQAYEFVVDYQARPYVILPNDRMDFRHLDFYGRSNEAKRLYHYPEWLRFCQRFIKTMDSRVSASVANAMQYYAPTTIAHETRYTAIPDMVLPDVEWRFRWYGIPDRYVTSPESWLIKLKGYLNQTPFLGKPRGSLLFMGPEVVRTYVPTQFEATIPNEDEPSALDGSFATEVLLDLDLVFILTSRGDLEVTRIPGVPFNKANPYGVPAEVTPNRNWIPAGHNLMPHFATKKFYYAISSAVGIPPDYSKAVPSYPSWPFEALFVDPDVPELVIDL